MTIAFEKATVILEIIDIFRKMNPEMCFRSDWSLESETVWLVIRWRDDLDTWWESTLDMSLATNKLDAARRATARLREGVEKLNAERGLFGVPILDQFHNQSLQQRIFPSN